MRPGGLSELLFLAQGTDKQHRVSMRDFHRGRNRMVLLLDQQD